VAGSTGNESTRSQSGGCGDGDRNFVVSNSERSGQGDITRIGEFIAVGDNIADGIVGDRSGRLDERQSRCLGRGDGDVVFIGIEFAVVRLSGILDGAGVEVGLGDGVAGSQCDEFTWCEYHTVSGRSHGELVVGDGEGSRQGDIAGVGDPVAVGDDVANRVVGVWIGGFQKRDGGSLGRIDRSGVGDRCSFIGGSCRYVVHLAGIEVGLGDRIGTG